MRNWTTFDQVHDEHGGYRRFPVVPATGRTAESIGFAPDRGADRGTLRHGYGSHGPFGATGAGGYADPYGDRYQLPLDGFQDDTDGAARYDEVGCEVWVRGRAFILAALAGWSVVALIVLLVIGVVSALT